MSWRFLCPHISFSEFPKTTLQYEWSVDKSGNIKELEEKIISSVLEINGHYNAKKDETKIVLKKEAEREGREERKKIPELVIVELITDNGITRANY